ncbi:MAG: class I SAM-dependent methyltransferase [Phenylobacterium sp.]
MSGPRDFTYAIHSEKNIDNSSKLDGTVRFYAFVRSIMLRGKAREVLDFGAGRGAFWYLNTEQDGSLLRRHLQDLRFEGATVTACDVDPVVLTHPCSHQQVVLEMGKALPFPDAAFDLIISDVTFEHIEDPEQVAGELLRVLRPGGYICARTPNKFGYVKLLTSLVPNSRHVALLKRVQPDRAAEDVFPTRYRLNSVNDARRHFRGCDIYHYTDSSEPSYYFGNSIFYRALLLFHKLLPDCFATSICFFIRKR